MGPHLTVGQFMEPHFEEFKVLEIADADAVAADLGRLHHTTSKLCCADLFPSEIFLLYAVHFLV
jgi:hypothetical protein